MILYKSFESTAQKKYRNSAKNIKDTFGILFVNVTFLFILDFVQITTVIYFVFNIPAALFEITLALFMFIKVFNVILDYSH